MAGDTLYGIPNGGTAPEAQTNIPIHSDMLLEKTPVTEWTTSDGSLTGIPGKWFFTPENVWSPQDDDYSSGISELKDIMEDKNVYGKWTFTPDPKVGNLTVSKTVSGNAADNSREFRFTVTLGDTSVSGTCGDISFTSGIATFTLKGGESKTSTGLPAGMTYTVSEENCSADGYITTRSGDIGTIPDGQTASAVFTNTKNANPPSPMPDSKVGNLMIIKNVTGDLGDRTRYFTFRVVFSSDGLFRYSGSCSGTIESGGSIELRHGENVTIYGIPEGTRYTVTESGGNGYNIYSSGNIGIISDGNTSVAKFTNTRSSVPKTEDVGNRPLWIGLMGISALGMAGTLFIDNEDRSKKPAHLKSR